MTFANKQTGGVTHAAVLDGSVTTVSGAIDSTGKFFPLDSCQQVITTDTAGKVLTIDATDGVSTWRQTFTYTATTTTISKWVKQ